MATKRLGQATQNPVAAIFIGAFAANCSSLVTRHPRDFIHWFPPLKVREP